MRTAGSTAAVCDRPLDFWRILPVPSSSERETLRVRNPQGMSLGEASKRAGDLASMQRGAAHGKPDGVSSMVKAWTIMCEDFPIALEAMSHESTDLAQLVAGGYLAFEKVISSLVETGCRIGLDESEVERMIESGFEAGLRQSRRVAS